MTEEQWLVEADPTRMLHFIRERASERKLRLLICAVIRHSPHHPDGRTVWELLPTYSWFYPAEKGSRYRLNCHHVLQLAEQITDDAATADEIELAFEVGQATVFCAESHTPLYTNDPIPDCWEPYTSARLVELATGGKPPSFASFCSDYPVELHPDFLPVGRPILRDIIGNPFRPVVVDLGWLTSTVLALATGIYADRAFDRMPILADALQDAGCDNDDMLTHCRGDGPHVRGCWVVDLLLGKS